jgi:Xaa-Pro aminopeptidase
LILPKTSYAISLMLTHFRSTVTSFIIDDVKAVKNETEIEGMRRAYLRDEASFVRWLVQLENKLSQGFDVTEYEAA